MVSILGMFHGSAWSALGKAQVGELPKSWFYSDGKSTEREFKRPGVLHFYKLIFEAFLFSCVTKSMQHSFWELAAFFFFLPATLCHLLHQKLFVLSI